MKSIFGSRNAAPTAAVGPTTPGSTTALPDPVGRQQAGAGRTQLPVAGRTRTDSGERWSSIGFDDRMSTVDFHVGERAHIEVDSEICKSCTTKACISACPANLFAPTSDGGVLFNYEQCFECGTCYQVCNSAGAITWTYPDGGQGVVFRNG